MSTVYYVKLITLKLEKKQRNRYLLIKTKTIEYKS